VIHTLEELMAVTAAAAKIQEERHLQQQQDNTNPMVGVAASAASTLLFNPFERLKAWTKGMKGAANTSDRTDTAEMEYLETVLNKDIMEESHTSSSRNHRHRMLTNPLEQVVVIGNTSCLQPSHPTIQLVIKRLKENSIPGKRSADDNEKIALCIEGGGMRGCVSAGAVAALNFLGLNDAVDVVYGSSAGAMIATYFVSRQYTGLNVFYGK
jgi:hypothetical protein